VDAGRFRSDLYARLNGAPIRTPPLRERTEDIPRLVSHFLHRAAETLGTSVPAVSAEAMQLLQSYRWPGNIRELSNAMERGAILGRNGTLLPAHLDITGGAGGDLAASSPPDPPVPPASSRPVFNLDELEKQAIDRALAATGGNRTRAAKLLGISERTLRNKLNVPKVAAAKQ
jgi:DNA-binding NtrC family response regulator